MSPTERGGSQQPAIISRARVRILQGIALLHATAGQVFDDIEPATPDACLQAADELWQLLVKQREAAPDAWRDMEIDGRTADEILGRLNDVVYEIVAAQAASDLTLPRDS